MTNEEIITNARDFVSFLESSKDVRGIMADLRAAMSDTLAYRAWSHLARFHGVNDFLYAEMVRTVAYMYSVCPRHSKRAGNFGQTLFAICKARSHAKRVAAKDSEKQKYDPSLQRLLAAERSSVCDRVRRYAGYLRALKEISVDYEQLLIDLCYWSPRIKEQWADVYYNLKEGA